MDIPTTPRERCDPVEYAELKDMSQEALRAAYCDVAALAKQRADEAELSAKLASVDASFARRDAFKKYAAQCADQKVRVARIYEQRFNSSASCATPAKP